MPKSTITITLTAQGQVEINVLHDPPPKGERQTWSLPARLADAMIRETLNRCDQQGVERTVEVTQDTRTGDLNIITRKKEGE